MTPRPATRTEVGLLEELIEKGKPFVGARHEPCFEADVVRNLVLRADAPSGVQINSVTIDGILDLRDARGASGGPCNALILEDCVLQGKGSGSSGSQPGIDAGHSHLQRLSLVGCQTDGVELSSAVIVGDLELNGLRPLLSPAGPRACWVKGRGVRVGGSISAGWAELSLPWPAGSDWPRAAAPTEQEPEAGVRDHWRNSRGPYALDLTGAEIAGALTLQPAFEARGGVNISGTRIGEGLRAAGAHMFAAGIGDSTEALMAQYAQLQGPVFLCHDPQPSEDGRFRARGSLWFYGARIGGTLVASGAEVKARRGAIDQRAALDLYSASLSADVLLNDAGDGTPCAIPTLDLSGAVVGGKLDIDSPAGAPIEFLDATTLRVGGDVTLSGRVAHADLSGSIVDGQLALGLPGYPLELTSVNGRDALLELADARVGRELKVVGVSTGPIAVVSIDWDTRPLRIRACELASYPGWYLCEALFETSGSGVGLLPFLFEPPEDEQEAARVVVLDGRSNPIHDLNDTRELQLGTSEQAAEYLTFFCAHVWGDEGAFEIVQDSIDLRGGPPSPSWSATAIVEYGSVRFMADFVIEVSGAISMEDDRPVGPASREVRRLFASPVRWYEWNVPAWPAVPDWPVDPPLASPAGAWREVEAANDDRGIWTALRREQPSLDPPAAQSRSAEWKTPHVDLEGLKVASLDDNDGRSWFNYDERADPFYKALMKEEDATPTLRLSLTGFEYDRISEPSAGPVTMSSPSDDFEQAGEWADEASFPGRVGSFLLRTAKAIPGKTVATLRHPLSLFRSNVPRADRKRLDARRHWLWSQYVEYPPTEAAYRPQPYQQLARVWRAAGHLKSADDITFDKLKLEKVRLCRPDLPLFAKVWHFTKHLAALLFVQIPFGFGLKPWRATGAFVVFWALGMLAIWSLSAADVLKVDASAVTTVVARDGETQRVIVEEVEAVPEPESLEEVPCGNLINVIVYPLDVMIPLLDLRQESRCHVSFRNRGLEFLKAVYAILGWLVISGLIVTWSGIVRRQTEG